MRDKKQREIDFPRSVKLRTIELLDIPVEAGRKTSLGAMKQVLSVLDSHARDKDTTILKIDTIAKECGRSRDFVKWALLELERHFLVAIERRIRGTGKRASEYRIIWPNLKALREQAESKEQEPMVHGAPSDGAWCTIR